MASCPSCTFENPPNWRKCQICMAPNPAAAADTPSTAAAPATSAACPTCTFENKVGAFQCAMCAAPLEVRFVMHGSEPMMDDPGIPGWRCPACTMWQADAEEFTCDMCNTPNVTQQRVCEEKQRKKKAELEKKERDAEDERKKMVVEKARKEKQRVLDSVTALECSLLMLKNHQFNVETVGKLLETLYSYIDISAYPKRVAVSPPECSVCGDEFAAGSCVPVVVRHCGHCTSCEGCFRQYVMHRIRDKDVLPFVRCPEPNCKVNLQAAELMKSGATGDELCTLIVIHTTKMLSRECDWVACSTDKCLNGFLLEPLPPEHAPMQPTPVVAAPQPSRFGRGKRATAAAAEPAPYVLPPPPKPVKPVKLTCGVCKKEQMVQRKPEELDAEFKKMIKEGTLRPCPGCGHMTMKEYGVCNVIECAKCAIWWNWRSRETGSTSHELKSRARGAGTLWEPGELQFQQKLEQSDPQKFKALLERNGVKYDPSYMRGT